MTDKARHLGCRVKPASVKKCKKINSRDDLRRWQEIKAQRRQGGNASSTVSTQQAARQSLSVHRERHQQAQGATIRAAAAGQDVSSRKLILRAFAAADEFKSARSLASSVRLKAQAKLIDDPEGGSRDQQEAEQSLV